MDLQFVSDEQKEACNELEACIIKHLPTLSAQVNAAHHGMAVGAPGRGMHGPFFQQVPTGQIPSASGKSSLPPAPPPGAPSATVSTHHTAPEEDAPLPPKKRRKQNYVCHLCGQEFSRKPALTGHLWTNHQLGDPIVCDICNKNFSQKSALTKHKKNVHQKKYKYPCPDCQWGTDDKQEYHTHRKRKHGKIRRNRETREVTRHQCKKCKKFFDGANLLRRHVRRGTCMDRKKHQCPTCLKFYITAANRDLHVRQHPTLGAPTGVCNLCQKVTHSLAVNLNHKMWHRGIDILTCIRQIRLRKIQTEAMKATSSHLAKKIQLPPVIKKKPRQQVQPKVPRLDPTKSAPPKLIPRRSSPRIKPSKKK